MMNFVSIVSDNYSIPADVLWGSFVTHSCLPRGGEITIDSYRLLSIFLIDNNPLFFFCDFDFRYQPISIGGLNRLISMISIDVRYRFLSINCVWEKYMPATKEEEVGYSIPTFFVLFNTLPQPLPCSRNC